MEKSATPRHLLRVPQPQQSVLSFCVPTVRGVQGWLDGLPKANVGETSRQLYQALVELNQLITPPETRVMLLECVRPEIYRVCQQMERHFLNQSVVLDERPRKVANLCQALQSHLATGYKLVVVEVLLQPNPSEPVLNLALQRACHSLRAMQIRSYQLYGPVLEGLWLELHQLYQIAREHGSVQLPVGDVLANHGRGLSVEQTYASALLLGCARTNQIRQNSIAMLAAGLDAFAEQVSLQSADDPRSLFCVAPELDAPPRYRMLYSGDPSLLLLGMDTRALVLAIKAYLNQSDPTRAAEHLALPEGFSPELLRHLQFAWGEIAERSFARIPGHGCLSICIGMTSVHYFLAGKRSFADVMGFVGAKNEAVFAPAAGKSDVWSTAFDVNGHSEPQGYGEIQFVSQRAEAQAALAEPEKYPVYELSIVNHSPGGYCLSWQGDVPVQLQAGELLGVLDMATQGWSVAVVRWIRQVRGGTNLGVELLAPYAEPCGVQMLRGAGPDSEYLRCLLVPEMVVISRAASLITPRVPFQEGNKVNINIRGEVQRALLTSKQLGTGSFSQFEYRRFDLDSGYAGKAVTSSAPAKVSADEDFDSLWKSL